jgi:uncharacterized short protein YbdD (DUF466 family)
LITYTCEHCHKPATHPREHILTALQLCKPCQDARFAKGLKAQREAEQR